MRDFFSSKEWGYCILFVQAMSSLSGKSLVEKRIERNAVNTYHEFLALQGRFRSLIVNDLKKLFFHSYPTGISSVCFDKNI
ncbi:MAG: hypothetical protein PHV66_09510 [Bacteroidales bacterium]|nr:hypothetical protein [Bacteroidales bacterium]